MRSYCTCQDLFPQLRPNPGTLHMLARDHSFSSPVAFHQLYKWKMTMYCGFSLSVLCPPPRGFSSLKEIFAQLDIGSLGCWWPNLNIQGPPCPKIFSWKCWLVICVIFTRCAVFDRPARASQNTNNEYKYSAILHTKTSNKLFIIQRFCTVFSKRIVNNREHATDLLGAGQRQQPN